MKRRLLCLATLGCLALGALGQEFTATWEKYPAPELLGMPSEDQVIYLYNVGYHGFYINHQGTNTSPYWQTRCSVNDTVGTRVKFSRTNPDSSEEEEFDVDEAYDYTFLLLSYVTKFGSYYCTSVSAGDDGYPYYSSTWTDNNTEAFRYFDLLDQGDNTFTLRLNTAMAGSTYSGDELYFGCLSDGICYLNDGDYIDLTDFQGTWAAVDSAVYAEYILLAKPANQLYAAAASLRSALESAYASAPGIDLSEQLAVYNNTSSTVAEMNAAEASISDALVEYLEGDASVDNPVDFTSSLTNPDFSTGDDTGWEGSPTVSSTYYNAEYWNLNLDCYQQLTNLPEGVYRIDMQAFYRAGEYTDDLSTYEEDSTLYNYSKLYAESALLGSVEKGVKRAVSERGESLHSGDAELDDGTYAPNTMQSTQVWFEAGHYQNHLYFGVSEGDTVKVGIKKETLLSGDWTIFDNLQLTYYGAADEAYQLWATTVLETATVYDLTDTNHSAAAAEDYNNILATLENASDKESIIAAVTNLADAEDELLLSVENYADYVALCETIDEWLVTGEEDGMAMDIDAVAILTDYLQYDADDNNDAVETWGYPNGVMAYILNDGEGRLTAEEIAAETEYLDSLYQYAIKNALVEGSSLTNLLSNPDFATGDDTGWSYDTSLATPTVSSSYLNCEVWNDNFDMYQQVSGLPEGLYALTANAFYRVASADDSYEAYVDGTAEILTYLYLNEFATPVKDIMEVQLETQYTGAVTVSSGLYVVNTMQGAMEAFEDGYYENTVYGLCTDGSLTVGIRNTEGSLDNRWSLWDNFQLTYMGKNVDALAAVLEDYMERATSYLSEEMGEPDLEALDEAYNVAEAALAALDADDMYDALYALVSAINTADASIDAYETFYEVFTDLGDALGEYEGVASADTWEAANALYETCADLGTTLSGEDIAEYTAQMETAIASLKVPDTTDASDDNPIDMTSLIVNPTFDTIGDFDGWEDGDSDGFSTGGTTSTNAERYGMDFNTYQDLAALPEGLYEVRVNGFHRTGEIQDDWDAYELYKDAETDPTLTAFLYATSSQGTASTAIKHMSVGAYDTDVYSTGYCATDSEGNSWYVPNTMADADNYFHDTDADGNYLYTYQVNVFINVGSDGALRIGVYKQDGDDLLSTCWCIFDDFELYYYGSASSISQSEDDGAVAIEGTTASASPVVLGIYTLGGVQVNAYQRGVNIVRLVDAEGNVSTMKVLMK